MPLAPFCRHTWRGVFVPSKDFMTAWQRNTLCIICTYILEMLCWAICIRRRMHQPFVKNECSVCVITLTDGYRMLCWGGYTQEDTLTVCSCHHTHGALIFNRQLMHPSAYTCSPAKHLDFEGTITHPIKRLPKW